MGTASTLFEDGVMFVIPKPSLSEVMAFQNRDERKVQLKTLESQTVTQEKQRSTVNAILLVTSVTLAMVVNVANTTTFTITLPTIQKEMHLQEQDLQWIVSAYPLSSGCFLLAFGRLADLYGRKKTFLMGSIVSIAFTLGCSLAKDVILLNVLRGFQGIGAAAIIPASLGILAHEFPPSKARSLAFATFAAGAPIGGVFGNAIGGLMIAFTKRTWRSACYVLAGTTLVSFLGVLYSATPDRPSEEKDKRVDFLGAFLVTAGLVQITFVLGQGEIAPHKWATPYIIGMLISGVLFILAFLFWQRYLEKISSSQYSILTPPPLLKLSIWTRAHGRIAAIVAVAFTNWCAFLSWLFWIQLYFQNYKEYKPLECVLRFIPAFVSGILCNAFVGFMAARVPLVWMLSIGTISTAAGCLLFAIIDPNATYWAFCLPAISIGVLGADFVFSAGTLFIAKYALPHEQSVAGALFNTMAQLGTAFGVTVTTTVYNSVMEKVVLDGEDALLPYRAAQWTACGFGILSTIISAVAFRGVGVVGTSKQQENVTMVPKTLTSKDEEKVWVI